MSFTKVERIGTGKGAYPKGLVLVREDLQAKAERLGWIEPLEKKKDDKKTK